MDPEREIPSGAQAQKRRLEKEGFVIRKKKENATSFQTTQTI